MSREIKFRAWDGSGKYVAGSDGLIYSTDFNHTGKTKALKGGLDKDGYPHVLMNIDGKRLWRSNHKLVALAFIGERPQGLVINHKNGQRDDSRPENLEYITQSQNTLHGFARGRNISTKQREAMRLATVRYNHIRWHKNKECVCLI